LSRKKRKNRGDWTKFGDDILMTWKNIESNGEFKNIVIVLMGMLPLRDWIAHGRCWERRFTQKYNPNTILMVAERLMHNLPHDNFYGRKYLST
jgi:hypothetical protein